MRLLLDTDVVVDMLRRFEPAMVWLRGHSDNITLAISGFSEFELVFGCRNSVELVRLNRLLSGCEVLCLHPDECAAALERYRRVRLQHGAQIIDTLVAQTALAYDLPLHTFNAKHYRFISGMQVIAPYQKT